MAKHCIFGLLLLWALCCDVNGLPRAALFTDKFANVILKSSFAMENDPARTAKCFQEYSPKIVQLNEKYEQSYNGCLNRTAEEERSLGEQLQNELNDIRNSIEIINLHFSNCSNITDSIYDLFQCYYNAADFTSQSANQVHSLARNKMEYVQIRQQYISYNQSVCTEDCFQVYNENSMKINADLENCLSGLALVLANSTTTSATPETTTEEHETTPTPNKAKLF